MKIKIKRGWNKDIKGKIEKILLAHEVDCIHINDNLIDQLLLLFDSYAEEEKTKLLNGLENDWNIRIEEVKYGLDEEYGKSHSYSPNYEGIFDDILEQRKKLGKEGK